MNTNRRHAVAALIAAGLLWGTTVPLSTLALQWLSPGWLTAVRFGLAAAALLPVARRQPLQGQLGQRHGSAPQQPGRYEGCHGVTAVGVHASILAGRHTAFVVRSE